MATGDDILTQRAIDGEASKTRNESIKIVQAVSTAFVAGQTFKQTRSKATKLMNDGLLSLNSLIQSTAHSFGEVGANKNLTKNLKFTQKQIQEMVDKSLITGETLSNTLKTSRENNVGRLSKEMARLNATGETNEAIQKQIIGTKRANYKDGFLNAMINNEETLSRTSNKMAIEVTNDANRQKNPDIIGYIWNSILDGKTSSTCLSLNGKSFYYDKSGVKPLPPAHPNCRSTTEPIIDNGTKRGEIPQVETVSEWVKNNPREAREAMGSTRYKLFTDGKMKIDRFTDAQFQPITLNDLKRQNEIGFKRAGLDSTYKPPSTPPTPPTPPPKTEYEEVITPPPIEAKSKIDLKSSSKRNAENEAKKINQKAYYSTTFDIETANQMNQALDHVMTKYASILKGHTFHVGSKKDAIPSYANDAVMELFTEDEKKGGDALKKWADLGRGKMKRAVAYDKFGDNSETLAKNLTRYKKGTKNYVRFEQDLQNQILYENMKEKHKADFKKYGNNFIEFISDDQFYAIGVNAKIDGHIKAMAGSSKAYAYTYNQQYINPKGSHHVVVVNSSGGKINKVVPSIKNDGNYHPKFKDGNEGLGIYIHEIGHNFDYILRNSSSEMSQKWSDTRVRLQKEWNEEFKEKTKPSAKIDKKDTWWINRQKDLDDGILSQVGIDSPTSKQNYISGYARQDSKEMYAEAFADAEFGINPHPLSIKLRDESIKLIKQAQKDGLI